MIYIIRSMFIPLMIIFALSSCIKRSIDKNHYTKPSLKNEPQSPDPAKIYHDVATGYFSSWCWKRNLAF